MEDKQLEINIIEKVKRILFTVNKFLENVHN